MGVLYCAEITGEEGRETLKMDHIQKLLKKKQDELDPMVFKCFMNFTKLMEELH